LHLSIMCTVQVYMFKIVSHLFTIAILPVML
jgi:hypothetical protein